jgi:PKD repeat protein
MTTRASALSRRLAPAIALSAVLFGGCTLQKQSTPALSGPSEFGTSLTLSASPEVLPQDGASQSVVSVVAVDASSKPISGLVIRWDASDAQTLVPVTMSTTTSVTDSNGRATMVVTAPSQPAQKPTTPDTITVGAWPMSGNAAEAIARTVTIRLQPPVDVPAATSSVVARFVVTPSPQHVGVDLLFDASSSTTPLGTVLKSYAWNFGDGTTDVTTTPTTSHTYTEPRVYPVTLTVTNDQGESADVGESLTIEP